MQIQGHSIISVSRHFWILEPLRGSSRVQSVVCVAHSPVIPVSCTLHPPCDLQSCVCGVPSTHTHTHIWYLDLFSPAWSFLKTSTHHWNRASQTSLHVDVKWSGGGGGVSLTFLHTCGAHMTVTPVHYHVFWKLHLKFLFKPEHVFTLLTVQR